MSYESTRFNCDAVPDDSLLVEPYGPTTVINIVRVECSSGMGDEVQFRYRRQDDFENYLAIITVDGSPGKEISVIVEDSTILRQLAVYLLDAADDMDKTTKDK